MRLAKVLFLLTILFSCNSSESNKTLNAVTETTKQNEDLPIYIAQVNELRMREKPDITSKVLYVVKEQEEVFYLNEKTDFTETIKLRGIDYTEPWLKVRTQKDNIEGWVFGGGLKPEIPIDIQAEAKKAGRQIKKLKNVPSKQISQILSLEINNQYNRYNGFYQYYLTANNAEILDGKFELEAQDIKSPNEVDHSYISYKGTYINGTKNGEFFQNFGQWEFSSQITLYYESSNQCSWGLFEAFSEGSEMIYKVNEPKSCTFSFIGEQADKYGKWTGYEGD